MRSWPQKGRTEQVVPAVYLPMQEKAFHLYKSEFTKARTLIFEFEQSDSVSSIQILSKSFDNSSWLYADTLLNLNLLPVANTCYFIKTSTYKTEKYKFVPTLQLVQFECNSASNSISFKRHLTFHNGKDSLSGNDPKLYLKNGFSDFFVPALFGSKPDIIHVSMIKQ
jgi:hypothetical protein